MMVDATPSRGKKLLQCSRFFVEEVTRTGTQGEIHTRQVVRHPGAVVLLPLVDDEHICLIRNYRASVGETLIELPAGTLEPGEAPEITAGRELIEETGFHAGQLQLLSTFYPSPGILDERMYLYLATELTPGPPQREASEEIENLIVTRREALQLIRDGEIHDAKTLVGLLLLEHRLVT